MFTNHQVQTIGPLSGRAALLVVSLICAAAIPFLGNHWTDRYASFGAIVQVAMLSAVALGLAYTALRRDEAVNRWRVRELALLGVSLVSVEACDCRSESDPASRQLAREKVAETLGIPFDSRTVSQVVDQLRLQGMDALPGIGARWAQLPQVREHLPDGLYPLSHASRAAIVECNENGRYLIYRSDEFGFNNPPRLVASGNVTVAVVGESFALGHCVPQEQSLVGVIRRTIPRTATFGRAGNGTLAELASFREYVEPLRPRVVLWTVMRPLRSSGG